MHRTRLPARAHADPGTLPPQPPGRQPHYDAALTGPEHYHRAEQLFAKASEIIRFRAWADVAGTKLSSG